MQRFRVTIQNTPDRAEQLRRATRARSFLIENVPLQLDSQYPLQGVHRDERGEAYFEFATDDVGNVHQLIETAGQFPFAVVTEAHASLGESCPNCGNVAGDVMPAVCSNCGFRDIAPCPVCHNPHPRSRYLKDSGNVFFCPTLLDGVRHCVRLSYNEPMFNPDGTFRQPLVLVREDEPR